MENNLGSNIINNNENESIKEENNLITFDNNNDISENYSFKEKEIGMNTENLSENQNLNIEVSLNQAKIVSRRKKNEIDSIYEKNNGYNPINDTKFNTISVVNSDLSIDNLKRNVNVKENNELVNLTNMKEKRNLHEKDSRLIYQQYYETSPTRKIDGSNIDLKGSKNNNNNISPINISEDKKSREYNQTNNSKEQKMTYSAKRMINNTRTISNSGSKSNSKGKNKIDENCFNTLNKTLKIFGNCEKQNEIKLKSKLTNEHSLDIQFNEKYDLTILPSMLGKLQVSLKQSNENCENLKTNLSEMMKKEKEQANRIKELEILNIKNETQLSGLYSQIKFLNVDKDKLTNEIFELRLNKQKYEEIKIELEDKNIKIESIKEQLSLLTNKNEFKDSEILILQNEIKSKNDFILSQEKTLNEVKDMEINYKNEIVQIVRELDREKA